MKKTAKLTQDFKAIKAALKLDGTIFTLKGQTTRERNEAGEYVSVPQRYKTSMHLMSVGDPTPVHSIGQDHWLSSNMNVSKFGSTKMSLYSFTPFGKRFSETVFYSNITIVSVKAQPTESESVAQPADSQPVKTA